MFKQIKYTLMAAMAALPLAISTPVNAVGGISAAKLAVPIVDTVPGGAIEFEPTMEVDYGLANGLLYSNTFGNRLTWGIGDNFEMGFSAGIVPADVSIDAGIKWFALQWGESFGIAFMTGLGWGDGAGDTAWGTGLIFSAPVAENLHFDFSTELGVEFPAGFSGDLVETTNAGFGWYFVETVQGCLEVEHSINFTTSENNVTLFAGITWDLNEAVILVFGQSFDVYNAANEFNTGTFFASTILIK